MYSAKKFVIASKKKKKGIHYVVIVMNHFPPAEGPIPPEKENEKTPGKEYGAGQ
jgi:hypothetical protein